MMLPSKVYANIGLLIFAFLAITLSHLNIIDNIWTYSFDDGTYSHAYLIVVISGYLYWDAYKKNGLIARETFSLPFFILFLACLYMTHIMSLAQIANGTRVMILLTLVSAIGVLFKASAKSLFPAIFLVYLLPIWGLLNKPLQELSVISVTKIMAFTPIPVFVDGNFITIPAGVFEIAGGCSGLRYLLVSLAISSLYIYLYLDKMSSAVKFLLVAILGALITNWIRITLLILIGHETNMESPLMEDHNNFGWYLYIPFMIGLFYYGQKISPQPTSDESKSPISISINPVLIVSVLLPVIASYGLKQMSYNNTDKSITCDSTAIPEHFIQPTLHNVEATCLTVNNNNDYLIEYFFSPEKLNSKTDYYANVFEPNKQRVIQKTTKDQSTILIIKDGVAYKKIVVTKYIANQAISPGSSNIKTYLTNALMNISGTKVTWRVMPCNEQTC